MAASMLSYFRKFGRSNFKESHRFFTWSTLLRQRSTHLREWEKSHFALSLPLGCNNKINSRYFSTSRKYDSDTSSPKSETEQSNVKDEPIPYSKSPAKNHKVSDTLQYDPEKLSSVRTVLLCLGLFCSIIYFGFIRNETESEKKIFDINKTEEDNSALLLNREKVTKLEE